MVDSNNRALQELLKRPENGFCVDCGSKDPEWASYIIGVFLCTRCATIHKTMGPHISKVKHIEEIWTNSEIQKMIEVGNLSARLKYEKSVPQCYRIPREGDPQPLLEEWIYSKYSRLEFCRNEKQPFMSGHMEGFLMKRGKEDPRYHPRKFILTEDEDSLKYYVKEESKEPKAILKLSEMNVCFSPDKMENRNSLQISFVKDGVTRHIFVYHNDPKTIVMWYNAVRCAKLHRLQLAFPSANQADLIEHLTRDFTHEGWLWKTGPRPTDAYKKRWFTLDQRRLMYHEEPLAAHPKGEIFLGHASEGFSLRLGVSPGTRDQGFSFTLCTPERWYHLSAETEVDRALWFKALSSVLDTYPTEQDNDIAAKLSKKRAGLGLFSK